MRFEIFDPRNGLPIFATRYNWVAKLLCYFVRNWDYDDIQSANSNSFYNAN